MVKLEKEPFVAPSVVKTGKVVIGNDSIVGSGTKLDDKTNVKRCIIGSNCLIGKSVRLNNCIIMDGVTIEDKWVNVIIKTSD